MREERTGPKKKIVNACASRLSGFRPVTNRPFAREVANHDRPGLLPYPSKRRTVDSAQGFDPPRLRNQAKSDWALKPQCRPVPICRRHSPGHKCRLRDSIHLPPNARGQVQARGMGRVETRFPNDRFSDMDVRCAPTNSHSRPKVPGEDLE
jgi:hypothetical protein